MDKNELKSISVFSELTEEELAKVAAVLGKKTYFRGDKIFTEGEPGGQFCIIQRGQVSITRIIREGESQTFSNLSQGMYFGIISLVDGQAHSATATATADTELLVLNKGDFDRLAEGAPACGIKFLRGMAQPLCQYMRHMNDKLMDMIQYVSMER